MSGSCLRWKLSENSATINLNCCEKLWKTNKFMSRGKTTVRWINWIAFLWIYRQRYYWINFFTQWPIWSLKFTTFHALMISTRQFLTFACHDFFWPENRKKPNWRVMVVSLFGACQFDWHEFRTQSRNEQEKNK